MSKPIKIAYKIQQKDPNDKPFWYQVGAVFSNKNGSGETLVIPEGISLSGRVVLMPPKEREPQQEEGPY